MYKRKKKKIVFDDNMPYIRPYYSLLKLEGTDAVCSSDWLFE